MFKKRYLPILIILLLVIGSVILFGIEWYRIYAVCRDELSSRDVYATSEYQYKYQFTRFYPPPIAVAFDDGVGGVWCHIRRNGLEWKVNAITDVSIYP